MSVVAYVACVKIADHAPARVRRLGSRMPAARAGTRQQRALRRAQASLSNASRKSQRAPSPVATTRRARVRSRIA